jgi:hypothetical protein
VSCQLPNLFWEKEDRLIHWGDSMEFSPFARYRTIRQLAYIFGVGMVPGAVLCADQTTKDAKSTQETGFTLDRTKRPDALATTA